MPTQFEMSIELLDRVLVDAVSRYSPLDFVILPTLFREFHGGELSVGTS